MEYARFWGTGGSTFRDLAMIDEREADEVGFGRLRKGCGVWLWCVRYGRCFALGWCCRRREKEVMDGDCEVCEILMVGY
jgi:hypothetical protein